MHPTTPRPTGSHARGTRSPMLGARALLGIAAAAVAAAGCATDVGGVAGLFAPSSDPGSPPSGDDGSAGPTPSGDGSDGGSAPSAIRPSFGTTVVASVPPPPISGGTLIISASGDLAIAADPDRDLVYGVNLAAGSLSYTVHLKSGDEPGRLAEDGSGRVHVGLRSGGALVTIDEETGSILARRAVCPAPRGVAWDATTDLVWVACATGELVGLPAGGGAAVTTMKIERDLRDVIIDRGGVAVSELRSAQILHLTARGAVARRDSLPSPVGSFVPHVAWRAVAGPSGEIVAVHQAESTTSLQTQVQGGYGGVCGGAIPEAQVRKPDVDMEAGSDDGAVSADGGADDGVATGDGGCGGGGGGNPNADAGCFGGIPAGAVLSVLTVLASDGTVLVNAPFGGSVAVDVAVSRSGSMFAAVAPGNAFVRDLPSVFWFSPCGDSMDQVPAGLVGSSLQATALAFDALDRLLVQTREPAALWIYATPGGAPTSIALSSLTRDDTGHDIFHTQAGAMIACASCHPEGREDGHVWLLNGDLRRTPSLSGTIAGTAPYHWPGDEPDLTALVNDVYTVRMDGAQLPSDEMKALQGWAQAIPAPPSPSWVDPSAAQRGKALFAGKGACASCHSGSKLTNNMTLDVGTGGAFQVPPLVGVAWNTPLLHDGCAVTLADRFGKCATNLHGATAALSSQEVLDLTAYLDTL